MRATALTEPGPVDGPLSATAATPAGRSTATGDPHTNWTERRGPVNLKLDIAHVSRILGHARPSISLDTYTHLYNHATHSQNICERIAASTFANLLY